MTHRIKLRQEFASVVLSGQKNFEVRKNERGYQKGDLVKFVPVDSEGAESWNPLTQPLEDELFEITYVLSGWGIKEGYVVFGTTRVEKAEVTGRLQDNNGIVFVEAGPGHTRVKAAKKLFRRL